MFQGLLLCHTHIHTRTHTHSQAHNEKSYQGTHGLRAETAKAQWEADLCTYIPMFPIHIRIVGINNNCKLQATHTRLSLCLCLCLCGRAHVNLLTRSLDRFHFKSVYITLK